MPRTRRARASTEVGAARTVQMAPTTKRSWCTAKERLNVAARTSPVRMV